MNKRSPFFSRLFGVLITLTLLHGCAITGSTEPKPKDEAEVLYNNAMEDLTDGLFPEAIKGFSSVRSKHPYSNFARLAMLRIADANRERGQYEQAVDGYRNFQKYYPKHELYLYALLHIGHTYYAQLPSEWWFLPPSAEKDQTSVRRAITAYEAVTRQHPTSKEAKVARERIENCNQKLASHELYVARFYYKQRRFKASGMRAAYLLEHFPTSDFAPEALLIGARALTEQQETVKAQEYLTRLLKDFGQSPEAAEAKDLLEDLPGYVPQKAP